MGGSNRVIKLEMYSSQESNSEMATSGHSVSESLPNNGICMGTILEDLERTGVGFKLKMLDTAGKVTTWVRKSVAKPRIRGIPRYEDPRGDEVLKMKRRGSND